jgi:outer membrane protein assembly factor BamA
VRADVRIDGEASQEAMLLGLVETSVGQPLSMASVRETIAHFSSLGRFQGISVDATAEGEGVALRYMLVPIYNVERIEFIGNLGLRAGELRRAVTNRFGATPTASRASNVAEMLQGYYFDRGFLAAAIRPSVRERAGRDGAILTFEIESGARAALRDVAIQGEPGERREVFLREIHAEPGRTYQRYEVRARLAEYVEELRHQGRFEARASHRIVRQSDDGRSVDIAGDHRSRAGSDDPV